MKAPKNWQQLKRHPLSAEYADLGGQAYVDFEDAMRRAGFRKDRPVVLWEGMVLDGWQRLRAAKALKLEPVFVRLDDDLSPEDYVSSANDHRRHESQEQARNRAEARRERVLWARAEGKSQRAIAQDEGVDQKTIRNDLKASGEDHSSPELPTTVKGLDNKTYSATKPKDIGDANEGGPLLCVGCERRKRKGQELPRGCAECKSLRQAQAEKRGTRKGPKSGSAVFDLKPFKDAIGAAVKQLDRLGDHYGAKNAAAHTAILKTLNDALGAAQAWFGSLTIQKV